jgi:mediator of RNA polymerase II transcription subunit 21
MDIIAQLQEQASKIAYLAFNTVGTLQRDAPPAQLSADYPNPPAVPAETVAAVAEQPKVMAAALVQAVKQFDALVAALPIAEGGEEVQCKRIAELQAENEEIGKELQRELDATGLFQSLLGPFLFQVSSHLGSGVLLLILEM